MLIDHNANFIRKIDVLFNLIHMKQLNIPGNKEVIFTDSISNLQ